VKGIRDSQAKNNGLVPIQLDTWGQFVFIMADPSRYCFVIGKQFFNDTGHIMSCDTCGCGCSADSLITDIICCTYKLCSVIASVQACQIRRNHHSFPDTLWHAARGAAWQNGWERAARKWLKATWRLLLKGGLLWASNITLTQQSPWPRLYFYLPTQDAGYGRAIQLQCLSTILAL